MVVHVNQCIDILALLNGEPNELYDQTSTLKAKTTAALKQLGYLILFSLVYKKSD